MVSRSGSVEARTIVCGTISALNDALGVVESEISRNLELAGGDVPTATRRAFEDNVFLLRDQSRRLIDQREELVERRVQVDELIAQVGGTGQAVESGVGGSACGESVQP